MEIDQPVVMLDWRRSLAGRPVLVGRARQNGSCSAAGCTGNTMYGDTAVLQLDWEAGRWSAR